jgi:GNAT superfamily N-acetyltransferase
VSASAQDLVVRDARPQELSAVRALTMDAYTEFATMMTPDAWLGLERSVRSALDAGDRAQQIVAERSGVLVGSVMLFPDVADAYPGAAPRERWPELRLLAVSPESRGTGVGRRLVEECVRRARERGAEGLGLHTSGSMRVAMDLYHAMGFERAPELDFQPEGGELVKGYVLRLS